MQHFITFILFLFCLSVVSAQDMHIEGDILLNNGGDRNITLKDNSGNGNNLTIGAGNSSITTSGSGGDLFLFAGNAFTNTMNYSGTGGSVIARTGYGISKPGSFDIQQFSGHSIAKFGGLRGIQFNSPTYLRGSGITGQDNERTYAQLIFENPTDGRYRWTLGPQSATPNPDDNDFYFHVRRDNFDHMAGWIQDANEGVRMNFTGQHRSLIKGIDFSDPNLNTEDLAGLIVVADQNEYMSMSGGLTVGQDAIMIDESLPVLSLSFQAKDKRVFGVISGIEAENRNDAFGAFVTPYEKEVGDQRFFVNSIGEGGIWVTDQDGELTSGDYIITSNIPGYGMRQESEFLANYTVAKITMDCTFEPEEVPKKKIKKQEVIIEEQLTYENVLDDMGRLSWEQACDKEGNPIYESAYRMRYLLPNGAQISKKEYNHKKSKGEEVYRAAFVGCTYHCG